MVKNVAGGIIIVNNLYYFIVFARKIKEKIVPLQGNVAKSD